MFPAQSQRRMSAPEAFNLSDHEDARPAEAHELAARRGDLRATTALHGQVVIGTGLCMEDVEGYGRGGSGAGSVYTMDTGASTRAETKSIPRLCTRRTLVRPSFSFMSCTLRDSFMRAFGLCPHSHNLAASRSCCVQLCWW